ncbi:MAG: sugar transporter permease [Paenibacillus sp.]|jgi:multiple sugar transport system permease protein|nr:sugar transporter permease [Paenibacillus sp.]
MKLKWTQNRKEEIAGYLFILPNLLGFSAFVLLPVLFSLILVFTDWDYLKGISGIKWVGFDNFAKLPQDDWFIQSLTNTFVFTLISVPLSMMIGLLVAVVLNKYIYLKTLLRTLFFLPYVSSVAAVSVVWSILYNPSNGPINHFLNSIGIVNPPGWLASPEWALVGIIIMTVWTYIGYAMIIFLAGLQGIPKDMYEAANIDGATALKRFLYITVPMLNPTSFLIAITLMIASFQVFAAVAVMTQGGPLNSTMVLSFHIYLLAFQYNKMGYASTISWILFIIIFFITLVQWYKQRKWQQQF